MNKIFITLLLLLSGFPIFAEEYVYLSQEKGAFSKRPKSETIHSAYINCKYDAGTFEFSFPYECEYMEVTIYSGNVIFWSGIVTVEDPIVEITNLSSECYITCKTDNGKIYKGYINL